VSIAQVIGALRCPVCATGLADEGGSVRCAAGHTFDIARSGYLNVASGAPQPTTADTKGMVASRLEFLGAGLFDPLIEAVARVTAEAVASSDRPTGAIVDSGGGTGEYLAAVLGALEMRAEECARGPVPAQDFRIGILLDASKHAAAAAARQLPENAAAVVCDIWKQLPLHDDSASVVLDVFAPRNAAEFARVLAPGGTLVVVTPTPEHMRELVDAMGLITVDAGKADRLASALEGRFVLESEEIVSGPLSLTRTQALAAASMGPSGARDGAEALRSRSESLYEPFATSFSARVAAYRVVTESQPHRPCRVLPCHAQPANVGVSAHAIAGKPCLP
jgi:23S rRNA (guanine745-N1)-methyltransferase